MPTTYANAPLCFAWSISTLNGNSDLSQIIPYIQSSQQLSAQVGSSVSEAQVAGASGNQATFSVKLTGKRGQQTVTDPIIQIEGSIITVIDPTLITMLGVVQYEVIPNWDVLVAKNIVGLGCHPDVAAARDSLDNQFGDIETPALLQLPELGDIGFDAFSNTLSALLQPPYDLNTIDAVQDNMLTLCNNFMDNLKNIMNSVLSKIANPINSEFSVDKNLVKADGQDAAVISVTPRDSTGTPLAKQLPSGVGVDVTLFTDFGVISDQSLNSSTGVVTANITSLFSGTATLTAQINGQYITEFSGNSAITQELGVTFISDAVLPKRRSIVEVNTEREPGGK